MNLIILSYLISSIGSRGGASRYPCVRRYWYKGAMKFTKNKKSQEHNISYNKMCINYNIGIFKLLSRKKLLHSFNIQKKI